MVLTFSRVFSRLIGNHKLHGEKERLMFTYSHIFVENLSSSADAWVGFGLICVYFVWMLSMAAMRIKKADHMDH
jgi:hypothetical protein